MAQVAVTINGRSYEIACDDGQEAHLTRLGKYIDKRVGDLIKAVGQIGDARLLVMVSLLIADELSEVYTELDTIKGDDDGSAGKGAMELPDIERLAERIESIAESLERT